MSPEMMTSLKHGLMSDGWLASQALLIWATDETSAERLVIIDGEHRWRAATELGFKEGPAVFLFGMTEQACKALTIKMNQKRGAWDDKLLAGLLSELAQDTEKGALALDLGLDAKRLDSLLASLPPVDTSGLPTLDGAASVGSQGSGPTSPQDSAPRMGAVKYSVVIDCDDDAQQGALFERFKDEGLKVRLVMA
jgi:hypothetical protein